MKKFLEQCRREAPSYGSLPFWSWNDRLEEDELRAQIRRMKEIGMGGFFMHARGGLETEYLSDEWFSCINACVDEAKKQGMEAWAYDENGWPSGFAGGKLLTDPQNCMAGLAFTKEEAYPTDMTDLLGVYTLQDNRAVRLRGASDGVSAYYVIRRTRSNSYVDTMNAEVTAKFIAETHEKYKEKIAAEDFGKAMPGFFTDEPQYNRWEVPYSDILPREFTAAYGYDLFENMVALFLNCEGYREYRYDYYKLCSDLFFKNFMEPIYRWCDENGCQLTGHGIEERSLAFSVTCCGSVMRIYEYEHIPGIDYLGREVCDDLGSKQLGSACAQLGKKKALSEMFACCGWDVSPRELKRIAEMQYVNGVNLMCQHLYPYSERGQRKRDYPAHYSKHLPWQNEMRRFDDYFTGLGYMLSRGEEEAKVLVIHPIQAAYMEYLQDNSQPIYDTLERKFMGLVETLAAAGLPYHFGEESMLPRYASVEGSSLRVGLCSYDYVLIPEMDTIDSNTVALLKKYLAAGGKLCLHGKAPTRIDARVSDQLDWLVPNMTMDELLATSPVQLSFIEKNGSRVRQMVRKTEAGRLIYITNTSASPCRLKLTSRGTQGLCEIDPITFEARPQAGCVTENGFETVLDFADSQAYVFIESDRNDTADPIALADKHVQLSNDFTLCKRPRNALTIDRFCATRENEETRTEQPIEQIRDELLSDRYAGALTMRCCVTVDALPASLTLATELPAGHTVQVNGHAVQVETCQGYEKDLTIANILPYVVVGENTITYTMDYHQRDEVYYALYEATTETLRNCLSFDSEIECLYLFGDFTVKTDAAGWEEAKQLNGTPLAYRYRAGFSIGAPKSSIDLRHIEQDGYPFFAGTMEAATSLTYHAGDPTILCIDGRYATCGVTVNGKPVTTLLFEHTVDLADYLVEGENTVCLALTNACRNLLGPHHNKDAEPFGVSPRTFTFEKQWKNGTCADFEPDYSFVRFGIDL
ncbi:MAG: hypothetical protein J6D31_00890 [Clostridia bacterium]|nr:hypothetical protein [Clostridia bacterium]